MEHALADHLRLFKGPLDGTQAQISLFLVKHNIREGGDKLLVFLDLSIFVGDLNLQLLKFVAELDSLEVELLLPEDLRVDLLLQDLYLLV